MATKKKAPEPAKEIKVMNLEELTYAVHQLKKAGSELLGSKTHSAPVAEHKPLNPDAKLPKHYEDAHEASATGKGSKHRAG